MKKRKKALQSSADVNMTPMLDIVFIMLIFFIVSTTFITEVGLDTTQQRNNEEQQQTQKRRAIVVKVCSAERIEVDSRAVDVRAVRANVERKLAEEPQSAVIVQTASDAPTGTMVAVMDQARSANAAVSIAPASEPCGKSV